MTEQEEFEVRYQRESIAELRSANKRLHDVVNGLVGVTTGPKPTAPVSPVTVAKKINLEGFAKSEDLDIVYKEIERVKSIIMSAAQAPQTGRGGPFPFDTTSPGIVKPPGTVKGYLLQDNNSWVAPVLTAAQAAAIAPVVITPNSQAASTANTAAIQAALTAGGYVSLTIPGVTYINATLIVYSNTTVYVGTGVTIRMADGVSGGVFTNYAARLLPAQATAITHGVAGAGVTYANAPDGQNYCIQITGVPGIGAKYPVGSMVSVVITGHLTGQSQSNAGYRGVWKVLEATASGLKYETRKIYPGSNNPIGLMLIYPADENIIYTGPGTIDGNGPNISPVVYVSGDPRGNVIWSRHARNVTIDGPTFKRGVTWTLGSNYVRDYTVVNCRGDVRGTSNNDFVHLVGAHQNAVLDQLAGAAGDNMVGMTIDITDDVSNGLNWTGSVFLYNFPFQDPGDMWGVMGSRLNTNTVDTGPFAFVGIFGPSSYQYHGVSFDGLDGMCGATVALASYPNTGMTQVTGDRLKLSNMRTITSGYHLDVSGPQSWNAIYLDDVILLAENGPGAVNLSGTGTIKNFSLSRVSPMTANARSFPVVNITTQTVTAFNTSDCEGIVMGLGATVGSGGIPALDSIGCPFLFHASTGAVDKFTYRNVSVAGSVSGAIAIHYALGAGAVKAAIFDNCLFTGTSSTGAMFLQGVNAAYGSVIFNNPTIAGAQGLFVGANTTAAINVLINGVTMAAGTACSYAGIFAGPTTLNVNGYVEIQAPTNNPFQTLTAAKQYTINMVNVTTAKTSTLDLGSATLWNISGNCIVVDAGLLNAGTKQYFTHKSAVGGRNAANQQGPCVGNGTNFYAIATGAAGVNTLIV